ncbi:PaaI family thioesterase [Caballeronia sp. LZ001]|uniref:PaaI family thioesterase n=1 Tax=Caballeronia sp. LZ001 TaxID=3038553 RepID=UPI00285822B2|nr:PaaI family thioesterase [Caballeronia sp. LZ001]MDR5804863.1 PaaI family thioesterase [Caballeronia sp. LZ001]
MIEMPETAYQQHLGVQVVEASDGKSRVRLIWSDFLANRRGNVHGGAIASIVDIALSRAIRSVLPEDVSIATIGLNLTYLEPGTGTLEGAGSVVRAGATIAIAEATVGNDSGTIIARASGTFRVIRPRGA